MKKVEYKTLGICGSRSFPEEKKGEIFALLNRFISKYNTKVICSGGAVAVDDWAFQFAREKDLSYIIWRPSLYKDSHPKAAPLLRNTNIVESSQFLLMFQAGGSRGTQDSINKAISSGKPTIVFDENLKVIKSANIPVDS